MSEKIPLTFRLKADDFVLATDAEKESCAVMRESVGFWRDGFSRLFKNRVSICSLAVVVLLLIISFVIPLFYPYTYEMQIHGSENLAPMQYSSTELSKREAGQNVFPHILGTDKLGRDYAARVMVGSRVSLLVGLIASAIVLVIGSIYGSVAAFFGGWVDMIMMRIVDIIYAMPDILLIILLSVSFKAPLEKLAATPGFAWINIVGMNLISIFAVFALLYWVGMARIVRSQVLTLKQCDYVTAARALGASSGQIIRKHLLTNCIGTLIVTTTLQIPAAIFTESFLSFLGLGVAIPMPSLGSLAADAINGLNSHPHLLLSPSLLISLIILSFNLLGDGLRDAFDPKMKK